MHLQLTLKAMETNYIEKDKAMNHKIKESNAINVKAVNDFYGDVLANLYSEDSKSR